MLACDIIEPSTSEWVSPMVTVRKKDNSLCLCVDYRCLNARSAGDAYPMPRVENLIDRIGNATFITTLDLTKGYWQVPVAEENPRQRSQHHTAYYKNAIWFERGSSDLSEDGGQTFRGSRRVRERLHGRYRYLQHCVECPPPPALLRPRLHPADGPHSEN